jgi:hypothetical protein
MFAFGFSMADWKPIAGTDPDRWPGCFGSDSHRPSAGAASQLGDKMRKISENAQKFDYDQRKLEPSHRSGL